MKLKKWFCVCIQPVEQPARRRVEFKRREDDAPKVVNDEQDGANLGGPVPMARLLLCQALVDASPEPVSIYDWASGNLLLSNTAFKDIPGNCLSLSALFALDPGSLQDAMSRVQGGLCWRGLIQLPAGLQSQQSLGDACMTAAPATRASTATGTIQPTLSRGPEVPDSASPNIPHAPSSSMLRQALQLVAYPSLRLHGPPVVTLLCDDSAATQPIGLAPADSLTHWRSAGGVAKAVGLAVTAATADAASTAADAIAKATRAAVLAKAAAQAAAAEAAAEAAAGATAAERTRAASAMGPESQTPIVPLLTLQSAPAAQQECPTSQIKEQVDAGSIDLKETVVRGDSGEAAGQDDLEPSNSNLRTNEVPSWSVAAATADALAEDQLARNANQAQPKASPFQAAEAYVLEEVHQSLVHHQGSELYRGLQATPQLCELPEVAPQRACQSVTPITKQAAAPAAADWTGQHPWENRPDGTEDWRLPTPFMKFNICRDGCIGDAVEIPNSLKIPKAAELPALPLPLRPSLRFTRHSSSIQPAAQPAPPPDSQNLLEALTTSTWCTLINGRHRQPMRRAATCAILPDANTGNGSKACAGSDRGATATAGERAGVSDKHPQPRQLPACSIGGSIHQHLGLTVIRSPRSEGLQGLAFGRQPAFATKGTAAPLGLCSVLRKINDSDHYSPSLSATTWASATSAPFTAAQSVLYSDNVLDALPSSAVMYRSCNCGHANSSGSCHVHGEGIVGPSCPAGFFSSSCEGNRDVSNQGCHEGILNASGLFAMLTAAVRAPVIDSSPIGLAAGQGGSGSITARAPSLFSTSLDRTRSGSQSSGGTPAAVEAAVAAVMDRPPAGPLSRCFTQYCDEGDMHLRRGLSGGLTTEATTVLRSARCTQFDTFRGDHTASGDGGGSGGGGGPASSCSSRPGSALIPKVGGSAGSFPGRTGSPVGGVGVLPRMLDLATKVSARALRGRVSASRLRQSPGACGAGGTVLSGNNCFGPPSDLGSGASWTQDSASLRAALVGTGAGGGGGSGPVSPTRGSGRAGSFVTSLGAGGLHGARQPSFSRLAQRTDTAAPGALATIEGSCHSIPSEDVNLKAVGTLEDVNLKAVGTLEEKTNCGGGIAGPADREMQRSPSGDSVSLLLQPTSVTATTAAAGATTAVSTKSTDPCSPSNKPLVPLSVDEKFAAREVAARSWIVRSAEAGLAQADGCAEGAKAPLPAEGFSRRPSWTMAAAASKVTGSQLLTGSTLPPVQEDSIRMLEGIALEPSPYQRRPASPLPIMHASLGGGGGGHGGGGGVGIGGIGGGGAVMEVWHEVVVSGLPHPITGEQLIMVTQHDVSARVWAEQQLARVMAAEHTLLEAIFPAHVLEHIAIMAAAAGPDDTDADGLGTGGSSLLHRPTLKGLAAAAAEAAETAGLAAAPSLRRCGSVGCGRMGSYRRELPAEPPALPITGDTFLHLATSHSALTVMFCDIQGFTTMCNSVKPATVMSFLNELYTRLDAMLDAFGVYKVETIGDCYMVAGGLMKVDEETGAVTVRSDDVDPQHAYRTVQFSKALLRAASAVRLPTTGEPVRLRVGIHSGPAMSGVVGTRMPRFCLFGDTINTASRMESTGLPGAIHVSQTTRDLTPNEPWEPTGGVEAKGKGLMNTYLLRPPLEPL